MSAAIICSAVLPAFAEEPDADSSDMGNVSAESSEAEKQELISQSEETQNSTSVKKDEEIQENLTESEEILNEEVESGDIITNEPNVTAQLVTWEGGLLKIPIDLGWNFK